MHDSDLLRYARHILLDEIGIEGQQRLGVARALIIGAGGLGCPAALYLASAGVGQITLVDHDQVDLTNLQRQIGHSQERIGQAKVDSLKTSLAQINSQVQVVALARRANSALLDDLLAQTDVVLDCCDNFATRQMVNAACVKWRVPLVSGAAMGFDGQISVYDRRQPASPCYACVFPPDTPPPSANCATTGIFAPLVGIIGSMQAAEALKLLCGIGQPLTGRLLLLDGRSMSFHEIALQANPACLVCAGQAGHL